jgi:S1-C subfamily serine protease
VDGTPVTSSPELQKAILDKKVGQEISLEVWRDGRTFPVKLRTAEHSQGVMQVANSRFAPDLQDEDEPSAQAPAQPTPPPMPRGPLAGLSVRAVSVDTALALKLQAEEGVLVTSVQPGSPAATAGVQVGDVITSVGNKPMRTKEDLVKALDSADGEAVILNINRGEEKTYEILKL